MRSINWELIGSVAVGLGFWVAIGVSVVACVSH
jgi:hypothetical protein